MKGYKILKRQKFVSGDYSIVPIRLDDRYDVMKWRNEQIYHLRQNRPLTKKDQDYYFKNVLSKLFEEVRPNQALFSYLQKDTCIGYGGLVHINWIDKNAEISFIMDTELEKKSFHSNWTKFLSLIEEVAFKDLNLHKIYVYAFDLRPHLYKALEQNKYFPDARLKEHCFFNNKYIDVVIFSKLSSEK
ncbi:GNAT family N-acetyltransferase [Reichenbachiella sp. MALMAid0571]|uniref:GNAT family N-acetyltransferase n=1 Tax=Reichenbachiella sp. MALMAid0571 TaxID=3143939 RepID=UPI0032DE2EA9